MEPAVCMLFNAYGYNARSELILAAKNAEDAKEHEYGYDDIGNRATYADLGTTRTYTANSLNQYTGISDGVDTFVPQFDDDGDQTLIQTKTGIWSVTYNGENRPVSWSCGETNVIMSFDRMGRRVSYTETVGAVTNVHQTFVYDNYLQIADNSGSRYVWDPSEPIATRPLVWLHGGNTYYYTHDGNKNVSEVVDANGAVTAHYEYAPFGDVTVSAGSLASANRFRFSSEYADDALGLVYYNYRHYEPVTGRWTERDLVGVNLYGIEMNNLFSRFDFLGRMMVEPIYHPYEELLRDNPALIKEKEKDYKENGFTEGGETKVNQEKLYNVPMKCEDGKRGSEQSYWVGRMIEVSYFVPTSHSEYNNTRVHEEHHVTNAQIMFSEVDERAVMPINKCLCKKCYNALLDYYNELGHYLFNSYVYEERIFDHREYGKRLSLENLRKLIAVQYNYLMGSYVKLGVMWWEVIMACESDGIKPDHPEPPQWPKL